jgi:hypothetical protein
MKRFFILDKNGEQVGNKLGNSSGFKSKDEAVTWAKGVQLDMGVYPRCATLCEVDEDKETQVQLRYVE